MFVDLTALARLRGAWFVFDKWFPVVRHRSFFASRFGFEIASAKVVLPRLRGDRFCASVSGRAVRWCVLGDSW